MSKTPVNYRPGNFYVTDCVLLFGWAVRLLSLQSVCANTVGKEMASAEVWKIKRQISGRAVVRSLDSASSVPRHGGGAEDRYLAKWQRGALPGDR